MKFIDLTGQKFARLTVLEMVHGGRDIKVRCRCDCGAETLAISYNVRNGNTKSCGCLARELRALLGLMQGPRMGAKNLRHGHTTGYVHSKTYVSWQDAKKRCYNPHNKRYSEYGGRGIGMCERWRASFSEFLSDMGEKPEGMTLERKDVNKGYEPGNCVWATHQQQAQNMRTNKANPEIVRQIRRLSDEGETWVALAERFGMSRSNVGMIVGRHTWLNVE